MRTKYKSWIQTLPKFAFLLNLLGLLWARSICQFSRNWNIRQDKIFPLSISLLPFLRLLLPVMSLWRSVNIVWKRPSKRSSLRSGKVPTLIKQRSVDMKKPVSIWIWWNKTVLIQHRALTCLSKSLAYIRQRELYSMGNIGLLRHEAEMTLLQTHLEETRRQELRNASFWPPSLFKSQLVKEGEDFLLKKGISKDSQGFGPYQNKPFHGSHKKRGSYRKRPYGGTSSQSSNQLFSSNRGKTKLQRLQGSFSTPQ